MEKGSSTRHWRLAFLACVIFGLFSLLIAQFYKIQISEGEKWTHTARRQHYFLVKEPFRRGTFLSNTDLKKGHPATSQPFVVDIEKFHLYADPLSIPERCRDEISSRLISMIPIPNAKKKHFREQFDRRSRSRKLSMWLDRKTRATILAWWHPYARKNKIPKNALYFINDFKRSYPFDKMLGQVLHTVQNNRNQLTKQALPTGGLELYFNSYLKGQEGKRRMMRSPRNSLETGDIIAFPEHGADVFLTINHCLQAIAEEELLKGVKECKAKGGWAVMMDPKTGHILALAQYPFFYPPDYAKYFNSPNLIEHTRVKAVTDAYEPGSVTKALTMAIALKANEELLSRGKPPFFDPEEKVATESGRFPGRTRDLKDGRTHYFMNLNMALQKSANIYPAKLVQKIIEIFGNEWYRSQLSEVFGVGKKTNIEIPSESRGLLPTPGKLHPNGTLEWSKPTPYSLAIGHNLQMNSIQTVRAFSVFANGGYLVEPTIVRKIVMRQEDGSDQLLLDHTNPKRVMSFPKVLSKSIVQRVIDGMKYVTKPRGSAPRGEVWGYTEAGKSGTAEKIVNGIYSKKLHVCTFIGFAPLSDPAFVLLVTMDEPEYGFIPGVGKNHHGGVCAAPVFREIATRSLEYLGIKPDDPYGYPPGDPRYDKAKADWKEESRQLQEMYEKWNNSIPREG